MTTANGRSAAQSVIFGLPGLTFPGLRRNVSNVSTRGLISTYWGSGSVDLSASTDRRGTRQLATPGDALNERQSGRHKQFERNQPPHHLENGRDNRSRRDSIAKTCHGAHNRKSAV